MGETLAAEQWGEPRGEHGARRGVEVIQVRIVIPPGQNLFRVSTTVSISRTEVSELRDALDLVLATGSSGWNVYVMWGENETDVTLMLEMNTLNSV